MNFNTLTYEVVVNKEIEYVFNNLLLSSEYHQWIKAFRDNVITEGKLELNGKISFKDADHNGIIVKVTQLEVNKIIELTYIGELINNKIKLYNTNFGYEQYYFFKVDDNQTKIQINLYVPTTYAPHMDKMWKQAIKLIQQAFNK